MDTIGIEELHKKIFQKVDAKNCGKLLFFKLQKKTRMLGFFEVSNSFLKTR